MKRKRSPASVALELAAVLLMTTAAFALGQTTALAERGYNAIGGEHIFLLIPAVYYIGKPVVVDWIKDICRLWKECDYD